MPRRSSLLLGCLVLLAAGLSIPASPAEADRSHTVQSGQTLSAIARRYRRSVDDVRAANGLRPNATLRRGQVLVIPDEHVTYVRRGQTLSHVAREHDCTVEELRRLNRLRANARLRAGQRLILPGYVSPDDDREQDWGAPPDPGVVTLRRRGETVQVRLRAEDGAVPREGLETLSRLMLQHPDDEGADAPEDGAAPDESPLAEELVEETSATDAADEAAEAAEDEADVGEEDGLSGPGRPHPRLAALLAVISDHFGGRPITIQSGFREVRRYTRETSRHVHGRATDIRIAGVSNRALWNFCRSLADTGCGYYPRSTFVHVDVRERESQWVDWSGPGQRPRYGDLRGPRPRSRRATIPRRVTRPDLLPPTVEVVGGSSASAPRRPSGAASGKADGTR